MAPRRAEEHRGPNADDRGRDRRRNVAPGAECYEIKHERRRAKLPRVNPRLGQLTVAEATNVYNVGLPTDRRAAALAVVKNTNSDHSPVLGK